MPRVGGLHVLAHELRQAIGRERLAGVGEDERGKGCGIAADDALGSHLVLVSIDPAQLLAGYRALTTIVRPAPIEPTVRADPDDAHLLACALSAEATLIVTRDRDLLDLGTFRNRRILPAHEALALIPR